MVLWRHINYYEEHMNFFRKELYSGMSDFGRYRIVEMTYNGRKARLLFGDDNTPQSGAALDGKPELLFDYNQRFLEMIASVRPGRILVIGGGVLMLPTAVYHRFPETSIDVVEIDPLLIDLARQYFDAPAGPRLRIYIQDGKEYLQSSPQQYDMIILDAFSGFTVPKHLLDEASVKLYKHHLRRGGAVAINAISRLNGKESWLAHEINDTFSRDFGAVEIFQVDPGYRPEEEQNLLFVASDAEAHFDYLQSPSASHLMVRSEY